MALQIIGVVGISRLLTPAQTDVSAVATLFASLTSTFREFGVAEYLIQQAQPDVKAIRAALTVNLPTSWLMALTLLGLAPVAACIHQEPGGSTVMLL